MTTKPKPNIAKIKKVITDYFDDEIIGSTNIVHDPIPYGTLITSISSTFLNGFLNYVEPISVFVLDRYSPSNKILTDKDFNVYNKYGGFTEWHKFEGTKQELINSIVSGKKGMFHTKISCFSDDIILLAQIPINEPDGKGRYIFFWFDSDVSDCTVGKFETTNSKEDVAQSVINWLNRAKQENLHKTVQPGCDSGIINYTELPVSWLQGWLSF